MLWIWAVRASRLRRIWQILGWWSKQGLSDIKDFLQLDVVVPVPEQKYKKMDHIIKWGKSIIHLPAYVWSARAGLITDMREEEITVHADPRRSCGTF